LYIDSFACIPIPPAFNSISLVHNAKIRAHESVNNSLLVSLVVFTTLIYVICSLNKRAIGDPSMNS
jgi:hypothetical protein